MIIREKHTKGVGVRCLGRVKRQGERGFIKGKNLQREKGIYKRENREIRKICESGELRGC
jgi:hypothetical protein